MNISRKAAKAQRGPINGEAVRQSSDAFGWNADMDKIACGAGQHLGAFAALRDQSSPIPLCSPRSCYDPVP
jgi:hypothetical protein